MSKECQLRIYTGFLLLITALTGLTSCGLKAHPPVRSYAIEGTVVSVDLQGHSARISHEDILGLTDAMTMDFWVKDDTTLQRLQPNDRIKGRLLDDGNRPWLEDLIITKAVPGASAAAQGSHAILACPRPHPNGKDCK
jgi:Cu/Ag efflux protein CusF